MTTPTLYYHVISRPSRLAYLVAKYGNIEFNTKVIDLMKKENRTEEYLKINPFHQVPVLQDGDLNVWESAAISRYLILKYKLDLLPFDDARQFAIVDRAYEHIREKAAIAIDKYIGQALFAPLFGSSVDENQVAETKKVVEEKLALVENNFFKESPDFVAGTKLSFADIFYANSLLQLKMAEYSLEKFPKSEKFFKGMQKLAFFQEVEKEVDQFAAMLKK